MTNDRHTAVLGIEKMTGQPIAARLADCLVAGAATAAAGARRA